MGVDNGWLLFNGAGFNLRNDFIYQISQGSLSFDDRYSVPTDLVFCFPYGIPDIRDFDGRYHIWDSNMVHLYKTD